ncbi:MAG: 3-dehydroquinate synthase [Bacteroidales bacterium]|nr:3-dehydroquinate synthase [Candidatus Cryptobacteroides aphodequi]
MQVFVIYDKAVTDYAGRIAKDRRAAALFAIDAKEENKTLDTVRDICSWLLEQKADRHSVLLAVGGGITSDIVGFAAAIYKRGIRYESYPTTLLSQVDASIGGKTGVNLDGVKNALGSFHKPSKVHRKSKTLRTLPREEALSGLAELLKTFLIASARDYRKAVEVFSKEDVNLGSWKVRTLIRRAARIKRVICGLDPRERKLRKVLNLGHTYGHAIELSSGLPHGKAVAIGIIQTARLAARLGYEDITQTLIKDFAACGLPTALPEGCTISRALLLNDKKAEDGVITMALPVRIGKVALVKVGPDWLE